MDAKLFSMKVIAALYFSLIMVLDPSGALAVIDAGSGEGGIPPGAGTRSDPAVLAIGTSYTGSISPAGAVYYKFTTGKHAFTHTISMGSLTSRYVWTLYSDAAYTNVVDGCTGYGSPFSCTTADLNPLTTYYLQVNEMSAAGDTYTIKVDVNIGSEGTFDNPVNLTVGSPYIGAVKARTTINGISYYMFTTTNAGFHTISLSGASTDLKWELNNSNSGLYTELIDCDVIWDVGDESCSTTFLNANTTYYINVENAGAGGTFFTVNISEGGEAQAVGLDEGTMANPIALTVDQAHTGTVAAEGSSYYKFTTGDTVATHVISIKRVSTSHEIAFYLDPGFATLEERCYLGLNSFRDRKCPLTYLDANTTYYFSLKNYGSVGDIYSISVLKSSPRSPDSEGTTISPVNLSVGTLHAGKVDAWDQSFYKFTATQAKPYRISLSGSSRRLHWVTKRDWDDTFAETSCHTTSPEYGSCVTGRFDAGQTVYLYVWNDDEFYADTYNLLVEVEEGLSEGTQNTPISLTPGTPHNGNVEASSTSYYQFTTGAEPLIYTIGLSGAASDLEWRLKKNGDLNDMYACSRYYDNSDEICTPPPLEPNTSYRIAVSDRGSLLSSYTLSVSIGVPHTALLPDQAYSETVDGHTHLKYYRFTTGDVPAAPHTISITGASHEVSWLLFSDPYYPSGGYMHSCGSVYYSPLDVSCTVTGLLANTDYYLQVYTSKPYGVTANYDILVKQGGGNEGSIAQPVTLQLPASHTGSIADNGISYYQFTTASGGPRDHLISLTGLSSDLLWRLYRDAAYTDLLMYCSNARGTGDEICLTTETLKAGTTYYLQVQDYGGYSAGYQLDVVAQKNGGKK